jgi:hypothetical protein
LGTSRKSKRPDGVAAALQVRKHSVEAQADEASNVLSKHPSGPELVHEPMHFRPEVAVIFLASLLSGNGERLAGEASANNVNCPDPVTLQHLRSQFLHIRVARHVRPVLRQHAPAKLVLLAEGNRRHPSPLEAQREAANARENVQHPHAPFSLSTTQRL